MPGKTRAKPKSKEIVLQGDLTIANAKTVLDQLKKALLDKAFDTITIGSVEGLDLTCLQLLCSFHRSAVAVDRHITLNDGNSPLFQAFKQKAGFERHRGCCRNPNKNCLWIKERLDE
jgi:ABC-type transporter Mla MlaB component